MSDDSPDTRRSPQGPGSALEAIRQWLAPSLETMGGRHAFPVEQDGAFCVVLEFTRAPSQLRLTVVGRGQTLAEAARNALLAYEEAAS